MKFKAIPVLRIFDEDRAREFYLDFLGFTVDWQHQFEPNTPKYLQISRNNLVIHLTEHSGDCTPGAKVFVQTEGLDELYNDISNKKYKYNRPGIEDMPWGTRAMTVIDPFNNRITFQEEKPA